MKSIKNTGSNIFNTKKLHLNSQEEVVLTKIYSGTPEELERHKLEYEELLEKWRKKSNTAYRYITKIENRMLYIFLIQNLSNKKIEKLEEEVQKLKDKDKDPEP